MSDKNSSSSTQTTTIDFGARAAQSVDEKRSVTSQAEIDAFLAAGNSIKNIENNNGITRAVVLERQQKKRRDGHSRHYLILQEQKHGEILSVRIKQGYNSDIVEGGIYDFRTGLPEDDSSGINCEYQGVTYPARRYVNTKPTAVLEEKINKTKIDEKPGFGS